MEQPKTVHNPHPIIGVTGSSPTSLLPIQLSHLEGLHMMVQVLQSLAPMWETQVEFLAPVFCLAQVWWLWVLGGVN